MKKDFVMKEVRFILPECTPNGETASLIHGSVESALVEESEGFTITASEFFVHDKEAKKMIHDNVIVYDVLIRDKGMHLTNIVNIAKGFAKDLEQSFVYFKFPNNEVSYLIIK